MFKIGDYCFLIPFPVLFFILFIIATLNIGCNSNKLKTFPVEGIVTIDGQPLEEGMIRFRPKHKENRYSAYGSVKKGNYKLQTTGGDFEAGAIPGEYLVVFSVLAPPLSNDQDAEATETLPNLYTKVEETPFSATVVKGKNLFNFELKSNP
ncbi:MAG: hypothetical protein LBK82_12670 [Planctomycetaceae bacterium]|jgi:hypothetical protein|nr:hypothetical protein [Planctomycetaceae bacterium]